MKVIIEGLINDFLKKFDMTDFSFDRDANKDFAKKLEYLINYIALSLNTDDIISWEVLDNLNVENTESVDGLAVIINGKVVDTVDVLEEFAESYDKFDIKIISTQVKSSEKIENSEINHFLVGLGKILELDKELTNENQKVKNFREIISSIFKFYMGKIKNIQIKAIYATLSNINDNDKEKLENDTKGYFSNIFQNMGSFDLEIWRLPDIKRFYDKTNKNIEVTIYVDDLLPFPQMDDIEDAYLGFISFKEFLKIIEDEQGNFRGSILFYDNPRDFLGFNDVNSEIKMTLESEKHRNFPVLNNGLTIVSEDLNYKRRSLYLKNFQIVNGCQTTHILYEFKEDERIKNVYIPIKFISTKNDLIKNDIIKATNNQTRIDKEELSALSDFQKILEDFYEAMNKKVKEKLYYERRKNQYLYQDVQKNRIIDMKTQAKTFASMFLGLPHEASGYYGKLTKRFGKDIFNKEHRPYPYYLSSFIFFKLMQAFNRGKLDKSFRKSKFHILMLIPYIYGKEIPDLRSKKIDKYCEDMFNVISKEENFLKYVHYATLFIKNSGVNYLDQKQLYKVETKDIIINSIQKQ